MATKAGKSYAVAMLDDTAVYNYLRTYKQNAEVLDKEQSSYHTSINVNQLKSSALLLAGYHNATKDFKLGKPEEGADTLGALTSRVDKLRDVIKRFTGSPRQGDGITANSIIERSAGTVAGGIDVACEIEKLKGVFGATYARLPTAPIHGDFQPINILFEGDDAVGLIDFEIIKDDVRLVDFIAGIFEMAKGRPDLDRRRIEIFFDEYMKHANLTMEELEAIPVMLKLNYLNRVAVAITDRYERLNADQDYRYYINDCLDRIRAIDGFDWDSLIRPMKVRQIVARNGHGDQFGLLRKDLESNETTVAFKTLLAILKSSTYTVANMRVLTPAEKMELFGKSLALAIRSREGKERGSLLNSLDRELLQAPAQFDPEALFLARSYINVATAQVRPGTKIATVIACHGEQDAIRISDRRLPNGELSHEGDDDFLAERIQQLDYLYSVNKNFKWDLILVGDGDDRKPNNSRKEEKTIDIARRIVENRFSVFKNNIRIIELSDETKRRIGSRKGGAVCLGMREALKEGADFVFFINAVPAYHAGQEGLLLQ